MMPSQDGKINKAILPKTSGKIKAKKLDASKVSTSGVKTTEKPKALNIDNKKEELAVENMAESQSLSTSPNTELDVPIQEPNPSEIESEAGEISEIASLIPEDATEEELQMINLAANENKISSGAVLPSSESNKVENTTTTAAFLNEEAGEFQNTVPGSVEEEEILLPTYPMERCQYCNRTFWLDRLELHETVCRARPKELITVAENKQNTEFKPKAFAEAEESKDENFTAGSPWRTWNTQHQDLMNLIAKKRDEMAIKEWLEGHKYNYSFPPPPDITNFKDYIQCQTCGRRFYEDVADAHLLNCRK